MITTKELARYEAYYNNIMKALVTLKADLELAERGWTIHIAIDFAELFAFAFPFTQIPHLVRQPDEPTTDIYSREQATLAFLFSKWKEEGLSVGNLILLPPYVEELRASLSLMQLKHFEAYSWLNITNTLQKRAFGGSFAQIRDIVEEYRINGKVPKGSKARTAFTCYVESQYSDVVSLLTTTDTRAGLSVLRAILNMGVLSSVQDHFTKNYPVQLGKILDLKVILADITVNRKLREWLIGLDKLRPRRRMANFVDASACAIIYSINESLLEHKAVLLTISHSRAMRKVTKSIALARGAYGNSKANSGIRDLDYLWLYYVHKEDDRKDTLKRVNNTLSLLKRFAVLRTELAHDVETSHDFLLEVEDILNKLSNLSLSTTTAEPLLKWLDETRMQLPWKYGDSTEIANAVLKLIREGDLAEELIARRDYEQNAFESLIQDMTAKLSDSAADT